MVPDGKKRVVVTLDDEIVGSLDALAHLVGRGNRGRSDVVAYALDELFNREGMNDVVGQRATARAAARGRAREAPGLS